MPIGNATNGANVGCMLAELGYHLPVKSPSKGMNSHAMDLGLCANLFCDSENHAM